MADNILIVISGGGTRNMRTTDNAGVHTPHQIIDSGTVTANLGTLGGAATEATSLLIKAGTDKIPASPAAEHVSAASPHAARLTDGSAFYVGASETTVAAVDAKLAARLPAALGTGGGVKVSIVDGAGSGGDGALLDGVSGAVKATVLDYANANPLAVRLTDTGGDYVAAGAGTQYTEDAAAAADPVGGVTMLVRADSPAAVTTTDGDNVAARGTNKGEQYVKHLDAIVLGAGTANVGDVDVLTVPTDPFGANADAASATGSISAKLRFIAVTGIPITGTVTVAAHAVTNAGTFAVQTTSVVPGVGATELGKAEDAVHASGDTGVMGLAVRRDANTSLVGTDGDYAPLQVDAAGSLKVAITAGAGSGGTSIADDAAFTVGSTSLTPVGGTYRSARDLVDDNDAGAFAMTQRRALLIAVETPLGDSAMDDTNDAVRVNVVAGGAGGGAVTNAGTFAVQVDGAALTSLQLIDDAVFAEDAASANADKGFNILAVRKAAPANTSGTDGDYESLQISAGRLWTSTVIDTALPAGGNVIGALTANQSVNVAQINGVAATMGNGAAGTGVQRVTLASDSTGNIATIGTSVTPGTGASNLGKAEDAAHASGDVGVLGLAVRRDANTSLVDTTGDYAPLQVDAGGSLKVAVISGGTSGAQFAVDSVAGGTDLGTLLLVVRDDALTTLAEADGDYTQIRVDSVGAVHVTQAALTPTVDIVGLGDGTSTATIRNLAANDALNVAIVDGAGAHITSFGGGTQYTEDAAAAADPVGTVTILVRKDTLAALTSADGDNVAARGTDKGEQYVKHVDTIPVTQSGTWNIGTITTLPALVAGNANIGDVDVLTVPADPFGANADAASATGSISAKLRFIAATGIPITGTVTVAAHAVTNAGTFAVQPAGSVAHDAAGTGVNPLLTGGYASATPPTGVTDGDAVRGWHSPNGAQVVTLATITGTLIGTSTNPVRTDTTGTTTQPVRISTASGEGGASDNALYTRPFLATSGGLSVARDIDLDEASPAFIKASAGQVYGWYIANTHATAFRYVKLYNKATAPVLASDTPVLTLAIPPMGGSNVYYQHGIPFGTGIGWAATTGPGDTDAGAPGANEVVAQLFYA